MGAFVSWAQGLGAPAYVAPNDRGGAEPSTATRPGVGVTVRVNVGASGSRKFSAGPGQSAAGGKLRWLGRRRNQLWFELTAAAHNFTCQDHVEAADV